MVAVRNEKGQFVKQVEAPVVDIETARKDFQSVIVQAVKDFAETVYGKIDQKAVLKAYRTLFDASYPDSYAWLNKTGLKLEA